MSKKITLKIFATILLLFWVYIFGHLIHMGTMPKHGECHYTENYQELCEIILNIEATEKNLNNNIFIFLFIITSYFFTRLYLIPYFEKISKAKENKSPPLLQKLFSRGILNPKAP